jgi:hypothetical protein
MNRPYFRHITPDSVYKGSPVEYTNIKRVRFNGMRYYKPSSYFNMISPSVTTILDSIPNPSLDAWKKKVGEQEATRISNMAKSQGGSLHASVEAYLKNEKNFPEDTPPHVIDLFRKIQPQLNRLSSIQMLEQKLFSPTCAGTPDCVAILDQKRTAIVDFKTAKRYPMQSTIEKYFTQIAAYHDLWLHRYPEWFSKTPAIYVPQTYIVIVAVEDQPEPHVAHMDFEINSSVLKNNKSLNEWMKIKMRWWDNNGHLLSNVTEEDLEDED